LKAGRGGNSRKTVTSSFIETNSLIFLFKSIEVGVKFYLLLNNRCLKRYYKGGEKFWKIGE